VSEKQETLRNKPKAGAGHTSKIAKRKKSRQKT